MKLKMVGNSMKEILMNINMVLLFTNSFDLSSNEIQNWLDSFDVKCIRINSNDFKKN